MKRIITIISICLLALSARAQEIIAHRDSVENGYNFWLYVPDSADTVATCTPTIIFLHGSSICGKDLYQVFNYGCLDAVRKGLDIKALIIAPQNPGGTWRPERINNVLDWVEERYPVDTNRVYVLGMSLGGFGTLNYAGTYPERVAAALALCGGSTLRSFKGLMDVPLWIVHGTSDSRVPIAESKRVIAGMRRIAFPERMMFDWLVGYEHGPLARFFYMDKVYKWLLSHSLDEPDRPLHRNCIITENDMNTAHVSGRSGKPAPVIIDPQIQ